MKRWPFIILPVLAVLLGSCAPGGGGPSPASRPPVGGRGSLPVAIEFVRAWENVASEPYFPLEGLAGCVYTPDGSLIVCDEKRGRLFGLDSGTGRWFEFTRPMVRPFRPVDVQVDGFKILALDAGSRTVQRFDLSGAHQDQLLDLRQLDPGTTVLPSSFALDRDGRMVIADMDQQQALLLDSFLNLQSRLGGPGVQDDQFNDPRGITFMPDGRILVADTGNGRLARYGRMGFFEEVAGGRFDPTIPLRAPVGVATDRFGNIFVADLIGGQILVLGHNFHLLDTAVPTTLGEGLPESPHDIAVGPAGQLAVTDRSRQAILIYRILYE